MMMHTVIPTLLYYCMSAPREAEDMWQDVLARERQAASHPGEKQSKHAQWSSGGDGHLGHTGTLHMNLAAACT